MHLTFNFYVWILLQLGVDHVFLNPIPFLVGSLFPDADHRKAPMGRIFPIWLVCRHRGFTHSVGGIFIFSSLVALYDLKWGVLFAGGYFLHLVEDSSTPQGVKWFG